MVLIARFYLKKRNQDNIDDFIMPEAAAQEPSLYDDETCVAWAAIPLIQSTESKYNGHVYGDWIHFETFHHFCIGGQLL